MTQAGPLPTGQRSSRRSRPQTTLCAPLRPSALTCSGQRAASALPAPSPPRGHVADQVSLCGSQLSRWQGGCRAPGLSTLATPAPGSLGPRGGPGAGLQSRQSAPRGAPHARTAVPGPPEGDRRLAPGGRGLGAAVMGGGSASLQPCPTRPLRYCPRQRAQCEQLGCPAGAGGRTGLRTAAGPEDPQATQATPARGSEDGGERRAAAPTLRPGGQGRRRAGPWQAETALQGSPDWPPHQVALSRSGSGILPGKCPQAR